MEILSVTIKTVLLITIFIDTSLFLFVFQKRKQGVMYTLLLFHLFGILGWSVSILMLLLTASHFWTQCAFATAIILALSKYFFVLGFPENKLPTKSAHYFISIPTGGILVASFIDGAFFTQVSIIDGYYVSIQNGPYASVYAIFITYLLIYPIFTLGKKYFYQKYTGRTQEQLKYLFVGTSFFL